MANTLLTPSIIANAALATLYETTVMAQLVHRDFENDFANAVGDTITVRKPAVFTANEFDPVAGISIQAATEGSVPVTLNHFADVSFEVTSKDMTLKVEDFTAQFLNPAMEAIAQKIDRDIIAEAANVATTVPTWTDPKLAPHQLATAGGILDDAKVPLLDRSAVVGPLTKAAYITSDVLRPADTSGSTEALRSAGLGDALFGFAPYMSQNIKASAAAGSTEKCLAFHKTAFALVTRPLALPNGVGQGQAAIANYKGFGLRVIYSYDVKLKKDVVSVDCLYGTKTLDPASAVVVTGAARP